MCENSEDITLVEKSERKGHLPGVVGRKPDTRNMREDSSGPELKDSAFEYQKGL